MGTLGFSLDEVFLELFPGNNEKIILKLFNIFSKIFFRIKKSQRNCCYFTIHDVNFFVITQSHNFELKI